MSEWPKINAGYQLGGVVHRPSVCLSIIYSKPGWLASDLLGSASDLPDRASGLAGWASVLAGWASGLASLRLRLGWLGLGLAKGLHTYQRPYGWTEISF